jgi:hypothetical protein
MSFSMGSADATIKVVVSKDNVVNCTDEEYEKYTESLDESLLHLEGEPTRFVLKKNLSYEASQKVMDSQASFHKGKVQMKMSYVMEEVRASLTAIENPPDLDKAQCIEWKRDNDGLTSRELIAGLQNAGVLMDLYRSRQSFQTASGDLAKKK